MAKEVYIAVEPFTDADEPFLDLVIDAGPIHLRVPIKQNEIDDLISKLTKGKAELES